MEKSDAYKEYRELTPEDYPLQLDQSKFKPKRLFSKGRLPDANKVGIAMVGTRRPSASAEELCKRLIYSLKGTKAVIVSGLAQGIDYLCHKAAFEAGIPTVAVLAQGLNAKIEGDRGTLAKKILQSGGALISEYEGECPAYKGNFVARNRIISGLSQATVIVQCHKKSGALITAEYTLSEGKPLFAVPGNFDCENYSGPNALLDAGKATPVFIPENLRSVIGLPREECETSVGQLQQYGITLSNNAKSVFSQFNGFRKTFAELQHETDFTAPELLAILTELEISGLVSSKDNFQFYFNGA